MIRKKFLSLFMFLFIVQAYSQTTYDFSTNATLSYGVGGFGIWYTQANVTIGGVDYILTSGGNGSFSNSANGGTSNSKCLRKDGSGGDTFKLARADGQPFQFYGIWVSHQSMNSYTNPVYLSPPLTLPPWYTLSTSGSESFTYQDMTAMTAGNNWDNYTSSSINISSGTGGKNVTSVNIYFQAIMYYAIDDIIVGPAVSTCTAPTITANPSNKAICSGSNTIFSIAASGATAYQWQVNTGSGYSNISNGGVYSNATTSTLTITGATAGMNGYTYRCVAQNGSSSCTTNSNSGTLTVYNVALTASSQTNISCNGGANGAASVNAATGGTGPYTYNWTPGNPTGDGTTSVTGLTVGTWTCTVTDANGCTASQNFNITQPTALALTASSQTNIACNGGANGAATVNAATGGAGGYTYNWTPGNPTGDGTTSVTGLTVGTWTCTVTDANGCTASQNFNITQPTALALTASSQTNIACNGGANGAATVNAATGGAGGYTYNWTPGNPTGDGTTSVTGLTVGTWTCTVTDANGCTASQNFNITQPTALALTASSQTNIACNGGVNGAATVNAATGGAGGYTYNWTPGNPTGDGTTSVTGLTVGTWTCTVTDANGCTASQNFNITQPSAISLTPASQTNVSCFGGSNGAATVNTPTGGSGGYTYNWTPGNPTGDGTASVTGLTAGTWTCTVTDSNSCSTSQSFIIAQPTVITYTTSTLAGYDYNSFYSQSVNVTGGTGSKTFDISSGNLPSGFNLSPSGTISGTSNQVADSNFTVRATDANGCVVTQNFTLKLNQIPITVTADVSQTKVYGDSDPIFTYTVTPALLSGDSFTGALTRATGENIGTYTINQGTLSAGDKYLITYVSKDFSITAKPITVTATPSQTKVYGTSDPVFTYNVSPSLVSGDSFMGTLSRVAGENIGAYAINQGSLSAGNNYDITYVSKDFSITAKPITVTADVSQTKVYGTSDPVFTYNVSPSLVSGDSFMGTLSRVSGENIGAYAINQGSLSAGNNYDITYVSKDFSITAKPITVTATPSQTKVYGTSDPVFTYSVSPSLISGDSFTGTLSRVAGENIGAYAINQGTLSAGSNYMITYVSKDFSITAKPITVTAAAGQTKVYGTSDPTFTYSVSPALVGSDSFTGTLSRVAGTNVGTYSITQGTLSAGSNYTITYITNNFTITAKPITVTATAGQTKVYGTSDPVFAYTVSPSLVTGDLFTGALSRVVGENVGTYAINQGTLTAGMNYTISYIGSNFTITKANQTITWSQDLALGCEGMSSETLTAVSSSGLPVSYASSNTNVATVSNDLLVVNQYGFATITASQAGNNNYYPATSVNVTVVNSQPNLIRKQFENVLFFDNSSKAFVSCTWYKDGELVPGVTTQFYKENQALNGVYYAKATRKDGMVVTTCPLILSPTVEDEFIKIVPNPVVPNASYELITNVSSQRMQNAHIEVYSVGGLLMQDKTTSENVVTLTAPMVEGIYIVRMTLSDGKIFTKNLLVEN